VCRRLFNHASWASLLLCVTVLALWVASHWYFIQVGYVREPDARGIARSFGVHASAGGIHVSRRWGRIDGSGLSLGWSFGVYSQRVLGTSHWTQGLWFYYQSNRLAGVSFDQFGLPCWAMAIVTSAIPVLRASHVLRIRRRKLGLLCPQCGYDLRATPAQCPECGRVVGAAIAA
jgi:4-amino-4-deoxy-L-arabinose transferase-like glycosyltransferase